MPALSIPIMFFQVACTAIPTLLIAVVVGIKQGATLADVYERAETEHQKGQLLLVNIGLALIIVLGELAALRAVARGSGNLLEAFMTWAALIDCLLLISMEFLLPITKKLGPKESQRLVTGVAICAMALALYILLIMFGVVPL